MPSLPPTTPAREPEPGTLVWHEAHGFGFVCQVERPPACSFVVEVDPPPDTAFERDLEDGLPPPQVRVVFPGAGVMLRVPHPDVVDDPSRHYGEVRRLVDACDDPAVQAVSHSHHALSRAQLPRAVPVCLALQKWGIWSPYDGPAQHLWPVVDAVHCMTTAGHRAFRTPALAMVEADKAFALMEASGSLLARMLATAAREDLLALARARLERECEALLERLRLGMARAASDKGVGKARLSFEAGVGELRRRYEGLGLGDRIRQLDRELAVDGG